MPPTTNAVAAGTNAINATTRGCRWEVMVSGCDGCYRSQRWISLRRSVLRLHYCNDSLSSEHCVCLSLRHVQSWLSALVSYWSLAFIYHNYVLKRGDLGLHGCFKRAKRAVVPLTRHASGAVSRSAPGSAEF